MNPLRARASPRMMRWFGLIVGTPFLLYQFAGWTLGFGLFLCGVSVGVLWVIGREMYQLAQHVRLRLRRHLAAATVVGYCQDQPGADGVYLALVSFVTREGELCTSVPLTVQYEEPPPDPERPTPLAEACKVPPVGRKLRVVYDPRDPTWADESLSWAQIVLKATCGIVGIALFGTVVIIAIAVAPQAVEGAARRH